jgi:hypothetical protein
MSCTRRLGQILQTQLRDQLFREYHNGDSTNKSSQQGLSSAIDTVKGGKYRRSNDIHKSQSENTSQEGNKRGEKGDQGGHFRRFFDMRVSCLFS